MDNTPQEIPMKQKRMTLLIPISIVLILVVFVGTTAYLVLEHRKDEQAKALAAIAAGDQKAQLHPEVFDEINLEAQAVYVKDLSTGVVLYQKNAGAQLPLASLTKLMTVFVADSLLPNTTSVTSVDGVPWSLNDLINITLVASSNDGAQALARAAEEHSGKKFIDEMNQRARALDMTETFYVNPTGLDLTGTQGGSYGSARDMAQLMEELVVKHTGLVNATKYNFYSARSLNGTLVTVKNTNQDVSTVNGIIASKTGFTDLANGNLVIAYDRGLAQPVVLVVLGSSQDGRFRDISELIQRTGLYFHEPITPL